MPMYYQSTSLKQASPLSDVTPQISSQRFTLSDLSWLPQDGIPEPLTFPQVTPSLLLRETAISLDSKVPMVPGLDNVVRLRRTQLGMKLYETPMDAEFDLRSPCFPRLEYNYLHDPHLKTYLQRPCVRRSLEKQGRLAKDGSVVCSPREYNEFRQWIRRLKLNRMEAILKEMYENEGRAKLYGRRLSEHALEWYDVNRQKQQKARKKHGEKNRKQRDDQKRLMKTLEQGFQDTEQSREEQQQTRIMVCKLRHQDIDDQNDAQKIREIKKRIQKIETIAEKDYQYAQTCRRYEEMREYERKDKEKKAIEKWKRRQWYCLKMMDAKEQQMEMEMAERREWMEKRNKIYGKERRRREQSLEHSMQLSKQLANEHLQKANQYLERAEMRKEAAIKLWRDKNTRRRAYRPVPREATLRRPKQNKSRTKKSAEVHGKKQSPKKSLWTIDQCLNDNCTTGRPQSSVSVEASRITEYGVRRALGSLGCSEAAVDAMVKESFGKNVGSTKESIRGSVGSKANTKQQKRNSILVDRENSNLEKLKDLLVRFDDKSLPDDTVTSRRRSSAISERLPTPHPSHSDLEGIGSWDAVESVRESFKNMGKVRPDMNEGQDASENLEQKGSGNSKGSLVSEAMRGKAGRVGRRATPAFRKSDKKRLFGEFGDDKSKFALKSFGEGEEEEEEEAESQSTEESSELERASMAQRLSGCSDVEGSMSEFGRSQRRQSIESRLACSSISINNAPRKPVPQPRRESTVGAYSLESRESLQNRYKSRSSTFSKITINNEPSMLVSELRDSSSKQVADEANGILDSTPTVNITNSRSCTDLESDSSQNLPPIRPSRSRMTCAIDPSIFTVASDEGTGSPSLNSQELINTLDDNEKEKVVKIDVPDELEKEERSDRGMNVKEEGGSTGEFARRLTESLSRVTDGGEQGGNDKTEEGARGNKSEFSDAESLSRDSMLKEFVVINENELGSIKHVNAGALAKDAATASTEAKSIARKGSKIDGALEKTPSSESELKRETSKLSGINIAVRKNRRRVSIDQPNFDSPKEAGERQVRRSSRSGATNTLDPNQGSSSVESAVSSRSRRFSIEEDRDSLRRASLRNALSVVQGSEASDLASRSNSLSSAASLKEGSMAGSKIYVTPITPTMDFTTSVRSKPSGTEQ